MTEKTIEKKVTGIGTTVGRLAAVMLPVVGGVLVATIIIRKLDVRSMAKNNGKVWMG